MLTNDVVVQVIVPIASTAITLILGWVAGYAKRKFDLDISAANREALHGALIRGLQLGLSRNATGPELIKTAVDYAKAYSPDAVAAAKKTIGRSGLNNVASALLPSVITQVGNNK